MKINLKGIFLFTVVVSLYVSCSEKEQSNIVTLEPTETEKLELGTPTQIIKLETSPESLLGSVMKTAVDSENDRIFVLSEGTLFIFNTKGNFITKVKKGKGPEELYDIITFSVDKKKQLIFVNQALANYITIINYNGTVLRNDKLKENFYMLTVEPVNEKYLFLQNNSPLHSNPFFIGKYDLSNDSITQNFIPAKESDYPLLMWPMTNNFVKKENRLFFANSTVFGLYEFKDGQFEKIISYDLGRRKVPPGFSEKFEKRRRMTAFEKAALNNGYVPYMKASFYFNDYNLVILGDEYFSCYAIDEKNKSNVFFNGPISTYLNLPKVKSFKNPCEINEDYLVFAANPTDFFDESSTANKTYVQLGNQKLEIGLEENPFLVIVE